MRKNNQMTESIFGKILIIILISAPAPVYARQAKDKVASETGDLSTVFEAGYILQDRNDDAVIDFVDVIIIVPDNPSAAHLVCAANIAARLGYESTGINLDLVRRRAALPAYASIPVISISVAPAIPAGAKDPSPADTSISRLAPGQGRIRFIEQNIHHMEGVIYLSGADQTGLIWAANYLAGRYPDLWGLKGKTFGDVRGQFKKFFDQRELPTERLRVDYADVGAFEPGVLKLALSIEFDKQIDYQKAVRALRGREDPNSIMKLLKTPDLEFKDVHKIAVEVTGPGAGETIYLIPAKPWDTKAATAQGQAPSRDFSLWQLYSSTGLLRDTNRDNIPDDITAYISLSGEENANGPANLGARLGLESAGVKIPIARVAGEEEHPEKYGFPILWGTDHFMINRLREKDKLAGVSDKDRAGFIQLVSQAFDDKNGLVISARDQAGLDAVSDYVTQKMPYLWDYGKGNFTLEEVETDVTEFFRAQKGAGQAAVGLEKLQTWLKRLQGEKIESISLELAAEKTPAGLEDFIEEMIDKYFPAARTQVKTYPTGYGVGKEVFTEEFEIPWEVDDFWRYFRREALPKINRNSRGKITVLVSESPEIREQLKQEIQSELRQKNVAAGAIEVVVLCAYKPGYSWLYDEVLPKIADKPVDRIEIKYHTLTDSQEVRWQTIYANTRWLQELFPIDEVLAGELGISQDKITFHSTWEREPIYTVTVYNEQDKMILEEGFSPRYVIQPFFELFEEYEQIRVTTGGVKAEIDGRTILDRPIATDLERFWEHFQKQTYRRVIDYVMDIQEGRLSAGNAPFFDEFKVKVTLSEPDYRIGVDQEIISSLDALHEDIMFETLTLFRLIGQRWGGGSLSYPGRILPLVQRSADGEPGRARIEFTGKDKGRPEIIMKYKQPGKEPVRKRYELSGIGVGAVKLTGVWVAPKAKGVKQLMFEVTANEPNDVFEKYKTRAAENRIDQTFIPVGRVADIVRMLGALHEAQIFDDQLNYDKVDNILIRVALDNTKVKQPEKFAAYINLPRSKSPKNTVMPKLFDEGFRYRGRRLIPWDTPMPPAEAAEHLARLNTFKEINVYHMARSFLGHDVFAADLYPPMEAEFISQAKMSLLKPTLLLGGRVHGNEVSSTSHMLRLAELCATDETYKNYLQKANLVLYPVVNPDGAQLAYELQQITPHFMLHAGRYGALGTDVGGGGRNSRYPEAGMVSRLREAWQPDIAIDLHGVPHHEWVQHFAGYSGWVTSRSGGARSYWLPRAWYIPGFSWIEDENNPEAVMVHKAITDAMLSAVNSAPQVAAANRRIYDRYIKYGRQDEDTFFTYFYKDIQLETGLRPRGAPASAGTYFSLTTEVADETAQGDWMKLACEAGLAHTTALLKYLAEGVNRIEHQAREYQGGITRSIFRKRPILPAKDNKHPN